METKTVQKTSTKEFVVELVKIILISLAIIVPIRYFLFQPFFVRGDSMEPNFSDGQYLIVDEISYRFEKPKRGDVVILKYPKDPSQYFIKRIIALPGERLEIFDGSVKIYNQDHSEGVLVDESYLPADLKTPGKIDYKVNNDEYFVLGDNRKASSDSRIWGPLPEKNLIGRVWLRGWPLAKVGIFKTPLYFSVKN